MEYVIDQKDNDPDLYRNTEVWKKQYMMDNVASLQTLTAVFEDLQHIAEEATGNDELMERLTDIWDENTIDDRDTTDDKEETEEDIDIDDIKDRADEWDDDNIENLRKKFDDYTVEGLSRKLIGKLTYNEVKDEYIKDLQAWMIKESGFFDPDTGKFLDDATMKLEKLLRDAGIEFDNVVGIDVAEQFSANITVVKDGNVLYEITLDIDNNPPIQIKSETLELEEPEDIEENEDTPEDKEEDKNDVERVTEPEVAETVSLPEDSPEVLKHLLEGLRISEPDADGHRHLFVMLDGKGTVYHEVGIWKAE